MKFLTMRKADCLTLKQLKNLNQMLTLSWGKYILYVMVKKLDLLIEKSHTMENLNLRRN